MLRRYPFNSPWVRETIQRRGLALWFALLTLLTLWAYIEKSPILFFDAHVCICRHDRRVDGWGRPLVSRLSGHRLRGSAADPAGPLVPFALLPDPIGWMLLGGLCVEGCDRERPRISSLPWWWLSVPADRARRSYRGTSSCCCCRLLLARLPDGHRAGLAQDLLPLVPVAILGQWRQLVIFALRAGVATAPFLPWEDVPSQVRRRSTRRSQGAEPLWPDDPVRRSWRCRAMGAMWVVGRERAAHGCAVPALWPSQQWYYATLALPARSQVAAFIIAIPISASGMVALFALALLTLWQRRRLPRCRARGAVAERPTAGDRAT